MTKTKDDNISQEWVKKYVDDLLQAGGKLPEGIFRDAVLRRAEAILDLIEAWRKS